LRAQLERVSQLVRDAQHLEPESQEALAQLLEELSQQIANAPLEAEPAAHLGESVKHLQKALKRPKDSGLLAAASDRLEQAIMSMEAQAPFAAGIARRLLDALANLGI
jgi:predicted RecB family endonuclease